ncbi:MAG: hypothetical protein BroJett041_02890 [Candidatus Jettenia caeni]|nr:MAG: hypothetical protein BroJett041_02890 [Candidatus Jettenia caeni]
MAFPNGVWERARADEHEQTSTSRRARADEHEQTSTSRRARADEHEQTSKMHDLLLLVPKLCLGTHLSRNSVSGIFGYIYYRPIQNFVIKCILLKLIIIIINEKETFARK